MSPLRRRLQPAFWAIKERNWIALGPAWGERDPLAWRHDKKRLRAWFHDMVRPPEDPKMCAYCDGSLVEQSRETIDHFLPMHVFPELGLSWDNLFPACDRCNSVFKRRNWSCRLVRPDTDPVESWFDMDEQTGRLRPSAALKDWATRVRVRLTIHVFRLNDPFRCRGRLRVVREIQNAWKRDDETIHARATQGPYRFVAKRQLDALQALDG